MKSQDSFGLVRPARSCYNINRFSSLQRRLYSVGLSFVRSVTDPLELQYYGWLEPAWAATWQAMELLSGILWNLTRGPSNRC